MDQGSRTHYNFRERTSKPDYTNNTYDNIVMDDTRSIFTKRKLPQQKKVVTHTTSLQEKALLPCPVRNKDYKEIEQILKDRVKEQDAAMRTISDNLYTALTTREAFYGKGKPRIYKMLFAGTSGCGKTETAQTIRHLLGMDPGYEYETQYVDIDGSTINNETQLNAQTGASPGLIGYGDKNTLAHRLNRALRLSRREDDEDAGKPEYLMLFIDEIDKAHPNLLVVLNGLLDKGSFEAACGERFDLPLETIMFVVFTANYGEEGIAQMTTRFAKQGEFFVEKAMREEGNLAKNTIERMGRIIIFYPLGGDVLKKILMARLEQYITESEISRQYGAHRIEYKDDVKHFLIDKVVAATDSGKGVRSGLRGLFENVHVFFQKALCELNKMVSDEERANLRPEDKIVISKREIELKHFVNFEESLERECELFMRHIVKSLLDDPHCRDLLPHYREKREPIDAMSVHFAGRHIVSSCFGAGLVMIQQNNLYQNCTFASVPEDYTHLKENMDKLDTLVKTSMPSDPAFYHKVRRIAESSRQISNQEHDDVALLGHTKSSSSSSSTVEEEYSSSTSSVEDLPKRRNKIPLSECFTKKEMIAMFGDKYEVNMPSDEEEEIQRPKKRRRFIVEDEPTQRVCSRCGQKRSADKFINYVRDGVPHFRSYCNRSVCRKK